MLSKIYQKRLEQLHEEVDRSIRKKISDSQPDFYNPFDAYTQNLYRGFIQDSKDLYLDHKIELLTKLEEL